MTVFSRLKKRLYFCGASYFRFFANFVLKRWHPRVFAIVGATGGATLPHLLEFELGEKAHYSHGANSAFGITFDILGLRGVTGSRLRWVWLLLAAPLKALSTHHHEKYYIAEINNTCPQETVFLTNWLQPEGVFWLSLGLPYATQLKIATEKSQQEAISNSITQDFAQLIQNTQKIIYISGDEPVMAEAVTNSRAKVKSFRKNEIRKYSVRPVASDFVHGDNAFHFASPQPHELSIQLLMLEDFIQNYLHLKLKTDFSTMPLPAGCNLHFSGIKNTILIDSSRDARLAQMASVLDMTRRMQNAHKWLVISDIAEDTPIEGEDHKKLAGLIADVEAEQVILIGRNVKKYTAPRLKQFGVSATTTTDPKKAFRYIKENLNGGEVLVFKGQSHLSGVMEHLLSNPADSAKLYR